MATVITFGIQKGGVGKSTSAGIIAYLLSKKYRVLAVDMDSQANLSTFLTGIDDLSEFVDQTILEALKFQNAKPYIRKVNDNLDIIPSDDYLATLSRYLFTEHNQKDVHPLLLLKKTLSSVEKDYDYIIIDTPPNLGEQTLNALCASNFVVVVFETSKFCYAAVPRFLETIEGVKERMNNGISIAGILCTLSDSRRNDSKGMLEIIQEEYKDLCFNTVIKRKAATGRLPIFGFVDNPELKEGIDQYNSFMEELITRVNK